MTQKRILILGGTADARQLAERLAGRSDLDVITSLAGRTAAPLMPPGTVRTGGFGGVAGLATYLKAERIDAVVDATHPFAATISANAQAACAETGTPRLYLARAHWSLPEGAAVTAVADRTAAAHAVKETARSAFLTIGARDIDAFSGCTETRFLVRLIEKPDMPLALARHDLVLARPPFDVESERALMEAHDIDTLVTKDSGGGETAAKIVAAADLGIRIVMIERPPTPAGEQVDSVDAAVAWVEERVAN